MSGYYNYSKSNNAVAAEAEGKMTASALAKKLKTTPRAIRQLCEPVEWHHTSCHFNRTNYYYEPELLAAAGFEVKEVISNQKLLEAKKNLMILEKMKNCHETQTIYTNSTVEWLEWFGTWKHPRCKKMRVENCTVITNGTTCKITLPDGQTLIKREKTNGFYFTGTLQR